MSLRDGGRYNSELEKGMLSGKTIVVTGAASGIGAECARVLKARGARVVGVDLNDCAKTGGVDRALRADLSDPAEIDRVAREIGPGADGLCNIAGLPSLPDAAKVLRVNFLAVRRLTLALVPAMSDGASIVNMASIAGRNWAASRSDIRELLALADFAAAAALCESKEVNGLRAYFLSKEALLVWTMQNRWTWRERGIRMNCVCPGPVDTPLLARLLQDVGNHNEEARRQMDRAGTPEDIAAAAAFLCADESRWFRGASLPCDGGLSAHMILQDAEFPSKGWGERKG